MTGMGFGDAVRDGRIARGRDLSEERFHRQRPIGKGSSRRNLHVQDRHGAGLGAGVGFDERVCLRALQFEGRGIDVGAEPDDSVAVLEPLGGAHSIGVLVDGNSAAGAYLVTILPYLRRRHRAPVERELQARGYTARLQPPDGRFRCRRGGDFRSRACGRNARGRTCRLGWGR